MHRTGKTGAERKHRNGCSGRRSSRTLGDYNRAVGGAESFRGLKPERQADRRSDGNNSGRHDGRWPDVAQAAAMLAGVMGFLLISVGC